MDIIVRLSQPKTDKERLFKVEASVEDLKNPGIAYITLQGREYIVEIHFDK